MEVNKETLPKGWTIAKLGNLVITEKGKKPKRVSKEKNEECSIPYVNIKAFEKNIIDEYTDGVGCVICEDDDFLMVWDGSRSGYVGKAIKGALGSTLVRIKLPLLNQDYVYYFLQSKFIEINTRAKGVGIPHVDPNLLWNYDFPIAPLPEQTRILAKLEQLLTDLDKGIEYLETTKQQLKVYRQAVLKWAFEGKLTNKDVKDGELPIGWDSKKISQVADTFGGYAFKSSEFESQGKFQVIRMGNVRPGILRLDESPVFISKLDERALSKALLKVNDIIVTQTGTKGKRDYGFTALISKDSLLLNQRIAAIRCNKDCVPKFLLYYTWTNKFKDQFFANETGNVGQGNVGMKAVTDTIIWIPKPADQIKVVSEIESRLSVCDKIEETIESSLQQAEALRLSIIKKAFEGKLVPQDPNDEPAEKLLERVRAAKENGIPEKKEKVKSEKKPAQKRKDKIEI